MDIFWNYTVRLNIYNALKLPRKFRVNTLHIYGDRPPPSFFLLFFLLTLDDSVLNLPRPSVKQCRYLFFFEACKPPLLFFYFKIPTVPFKAGYIIAS